MKKAGLIILFLILQDAHGALSIIGFRGIYESLLQSIGMSQSPALRAVFTKVKEQLPQFGYPVEINASSQMAILAMASTACHELIRSDSQIATERRWVHRKINFNDGVNQLLTETPNFVFQEYAEIFWQRDVLPNEIKLLQKMVGETMDNPSDILEGLLMVCTTMASAPDFFVFL